MLCYTEFSVNTSFLSGLHRRVGPDRQNAKPAQPVGLSRHASHSSQFVKRPFRSSGQRQVFRAYLAAHLVFLEFVRNLLAFSQPTKTGALDGADVNEHILAAIARLNESKALLTVEPLHCSGSHSLFSKARRLFVPHGDRADSIQSRRCLRKRPQGRVQKGKASIER